MTVAALFRVASPRFVAGFVVDPDTRTVTLAAPIIKYMTGWPSTKAAEYINRRGWAVQRVVAEDGGIGRQT